MGKWNSNSISIFRFSFWYDIEKQIWMLLFVFRFRLTFKNAFELRFSFFVFASLSKTHLNFVFRFSFSHHFEKRIWISFFVFTSLWKTDLISFLYGLLFEKQIWISFVVIARLLKNGLLHQSFEVPGHPLGVYRGIHFLCKGKQLNFLLPGAKVSGELPRPHDMSPTHGTPF